MAKRYKLTKEQVERIVENFVTEAAPEATKHIQGSVTDEKYGKTTKTSDGRGGVKHAAEAKKHVQGSEPQNEEDGQDAKEQKPETKLKQAPEAKKHVKGSVKENKEDLNESVLAAAFLGTLGVAALGTLYHTVKNSKDKKKLLQTAIEQFKKEKGQEPTKEQIEMLKQNVEKAMKAKSGGIHSNVSNRF